MKDTTIRANKISETVFYKKVIEELSKILVKEYELTNDDFHIVRIESPSTPGVPDINVCIACHNKYHMHNNHEFWIECKVYPGVLGSYQIAWKKKRELAGGRVFVVTYYDKMKIRLNDEIVIWELSNVIKEILHRVGL